MARAKDPRAAASRVKTEIAASRLNDELETELAMGDPDPEWARRAEAARADLSQRFGGFDRLHEISTDRPVGTSESRRPRKSSAHSGRRRSAAPTKTSHTTAAPAGRAPDTTRKPAPRTTRPTRSSGRSSSGVGRGAGRRAFRQTGIPSAGGSTTAFAFQVLGLMIGMALLYLVLSDAERSRGGGIFASVLTGTTGVLHRLISPSDPLASSRATAPPASAGGVPVLQPGESNAHYDQRFNTYLRSRSQPDTSAGAVLRGNTRALGGFPATTTP